MTKSGSKVSPQSPDDATKRIPALIKLLAGNTQQERDLGVRKLKLFLEKYKEVIDLSIMSDIWTGLHFTMWMQDQPIMHEKLADQFARLMVDIVDDDIKPGLLYFEAYLIIQAKEWDALDVWRMDKYMMMFRQHLHQCFELLRNFDWKIEHVNECCKMFVDHILLSWKCARDLKQHLCSVFLEELAIYFEEISSEISIKFMAVFFEGFLQTDDKPLALFIKVNIIDVLQNECYQSMYNSKTNKGDSIPIEWTTLQKKVARMIKDAHKSDVSKKRIHVLEDFSSKMTKALSGEEIKTELDIDKILMAPDEPISRKDVKRAAKKWQNFERKIVEETKVPKKKSRKRKSEEMTDGSVHNDDENDSGEEIDWDEEGDNDVCIDGGLEEITEEELEKIQKKISSKKSSKKDKKKKDPAEDGSDSSDGNDDDSFDENEFDFNEDDDFEFDEEEDDELIEPPKKSSKNGVTDSEDDDDIDFMDSGDIDFDDIPSLEDESDGDLEEIEPPKKIKKETVKIYTKDSKKSEKVKKTSEKKVAKKLTPISNQDMILLDTNSSRKDESKKNSKISKKRELNLDSMNTKELIAYAKANQTKPIPVSRFVHMNHADIRKLPRKARRAVLKAKRAPNEYKPFDAQAKTVSKSKDTRVNDLKHDKLLKAVSNEAVASNPFVRRAIVKADRGHGHSLKKGAQKVVDASLEASQPGGEDTDPTRNIVNMTAKMAKKERNKAKRKIEREKDDDTETDLPDKRASPKVHKTPSPRRNSLSKNDGGGSASSRKSVSFRPTLCQYSVITNKFSTTFNLPPSPASPGILKKSPRSNNKNSPRTSPRSPKTISR